jgi:DNA sulfur modification protein DndB
MLSSFIFSFPALRGIQAKQEYYVTMCPLKLIPKMLIFDDQGLKPEFRAQRVINKARIPEICNYIVNNPNEYVLSALTASIDGEVEFIPVSENPHQYTMGTLKIPMEARFIINDGQHRRAAIEAALKKRPELGNETIACVFFIDIGLKRCQQMFADLNRYAIRPTQSLSVLYDHRDPYAKLARDLIHKVEIFNGFTELEKSTISNRSTKIFTLSGIYRANHELLTDINKPMDKLFAISFDFWSAVTQLIPEFGWVKEGAMSAANLRKNYVTAHTITLVAIGRAGKSLLARYPHSWRKELNRLKGVDWRKTNAPFWEGRVMVGGKVSTAHNNIILLTNRIKKILRLELEPEELQVEEAFLKGLKNNSGVEPNVHQ